MNRRAFVVGSIALLAAPLAAGAQPTPKAPRIGYLSSSSAAATSHFIEAFRHGLREYGWIEGQNITVEWRFAEGRFDRLPHLADELVRLKVQVIVTAPTPAAVAAKKATATVPIVMVNISDPVDLGLVVSLARPGGNATGVSYFVDTLLRGAQVADLPVEQPTRFELVINMRTAKALGLTIPPSLLIRADQIVE